MQSETIQPQITIPRLPNERAERYEARVLYLTMGAGRNVRAVGQKLGKSRAVIERWSSADQWVSHARAYDEALAALAAQQHAEAYRAELEAERRDAKAMGAKLRGVALEMLAELHKRRASLTYTPATLTVVAHAMVVGFDLSAHALGIDRLLASYGEQDAWKDKSEK
jgi:hypothetical protein